MAVLYTFCNFQEIVFYHVAVLYTNFTFSLVPMRPRSVEREKPAWGLRPPPPCWRQNPPSGCVCSVVTRWGSQQLDPYIIKLIFLLHLCSLTWKLFWWYVNSFTNFSNIWNILSFFYKLKITGVFLHFLWIIDWKNLYYLSK